MTFYLAVKQSNYNDYAAAPTKIWPVNRPSMFIRAYTVVNISYEYDIFISIHPLVVRWLDKHSLLTPTTVAGVKRSSASVCMCVCPQHTSQTNVRQSLQTWYRSE